MDQLLQLRGSQAQAGISGKRAPNFSRPCCQSRRAALQPQRALGASLYRSPHGGGKLLGQRSNTGPFTTATYESMDRTKGYHTPHSSHHPSSSSFGTWEPPSLQPVRMCCPKDNSRLFPSRNSPGFTGGAGALLRPGPLGTRDDPCQAGPFTHLQELHPHQLQPLPLEPPDDLPDQVPLDPVRFDGHEGALAGPAEGCRERAEV